MPRLKLRLGECTVVACCEPGLLFEAEQLLRLVDQLASSGLPIRPGTQLPLGWSPLTFVSGARGGDLVLCEPHFDGDPRTELREDITRTLAVLRAQVAFCQRLGTASQPTVASGAGTSSATVTVACGMLEERRIFVERREPVRAPETPNDSGWFVGPRDLAGEVECTTVPVYELLRRRPALLDVLALPVGYLVAFDGDTVEAVLDTQNRDLWASA